VQDSIEKEKLLSLIFSEKHTEELKGTVACKGRATGPAKVILTDADFKGFNKGDVLVATWTEPKYTPIMKLASAIVTDEGGLTSHAAIVSRELNIRTRIIDQLLEVFCFSFIYQKSFDSLILKNSFIYSVSPKNLSLWEKVPPHIQRYPKHGAAGIL
jgi:phosphohistidine swiveling domain-containing protein